MSSLNIDLSKKLALVTGGTSEIGRDIVRTLAKCGADVAIHYYSKQDFAQKLAKEVTDLGLRAEIFGADLRHEKDIYEMSIEVKKKLGDPTILVSNAYVYREWKLCAIQDVSAYLDQFQSCVMQNVGLVKNFFPAMRKNGVGGCLIALNTECSMELAPSQSAYTAAKHGMNGLLKVLAKEEGQFNIRVNQVAPGWTLSEKYGGNPRPSGSDLYISRTPLRRLASSQDTANLIAFLASDLAQNITGTYIPVNSGYMMQSL